MTPHPFSLTCPAHMLYEDTGIPFVEFLFTPRGFGDVHPLIIAYYTAYLAALDRICREILLPKEKAAYEKDTDPRKRFRIRKVCLSLALSARTDGEYLTVRRILTRSQGTEKTTHQIGEVFSLVTGRCIPLSHFAGHKPTRRDNKKKVAKKHLRHGYTLQDGIPYLLLEAGLLPLLTKSNERPHK